MERQYVASISYGKDSLAMLHVITDVLHKPLDRIITAEVWATDTIQADLPPMVEFKGKADQIIKERWGIEVEHFTAIAEDGSKQTYDKLFHKRTVTGKYGGAIYGFPLVRGGWCRKLKMKALDMAKKSAQDCISYVGIAADEPKRISTKKDGKPVEMPLVEAGWTEAMCRRWCEENDLLSPQYQTSERGGCWFCNCQGLPQLRLLRKNYPDLWGLLLKWDQDAITEDACQFNSSRRTVHDIDRRFQMEEEGFFNFGKFGWKSLESAQMNIDQFL